VLSGSARVVFDPPGVGATVPCGSTVLDASRVAGVLIPAACAGRSVCGSCAVRVLAGELEPPDAAEEHTLARAPEGVRLACRARIVGPVTLRPLASVAPMTASATRSASACGTVAAVDLGTTTVGALLLSAESGAEVARVLVPNLQQRLGADVATRIAAAVAGGSEELSALAQESVADALRTACDAADVEVGGLVRVVIAANSAVSALLIGADVSGLAAYPFEPPVKEPLRLDGGQPPRLGLSASAEVILLPSIAGFVGGDAVACLVAAGLVPVPESDGATLLVDLGTNAEILLSAGGRLFAASAAAGPAFEGAGVSCGGPALPGAVESVVVQGDAIELGIIGGEEPLWLCGTGLLSALAALRDSGHLDASGALTAHGPLHSRFSVDADGVLGVSLGDSPGGCLRLDQRDVRTLQLAKAAVLAGVRLTLREAGLTPGAVDTVLVAGAFGAAVDMRLLDDLGVLPSVIAHKAQGVGNAALAGAAMIALAPSVLPMASRAARAVVHVDLAVAVGFSHALMGALDLQPAQ